jgi:hypothetical protein
MATISAATTRGASRNSGLGPCFGSRWKPGPAWQYGSTGSRREVSLNWLALGLLLAAWNVSNDDPASRAQPRPVALRGYTFVSVRAASLHATRLGAAPLN